MFDALLHRADRRTAAERYREGLAWLRPASTVEELDAAREAASQRAGKYLTERDRKEIDEATRRRLSIESARLYGDGFAQLPLAAIIDGSWQRRISELADQWSNWLRPEHRADQDWQAAEAVLASAVTTGRVDDEAIAAIDAFLIDIDPDGPRTIDDPWYARFATARLEAGLLPRAREEARLITQAGETVVFTEPGTVLEVVEELVAGDRTRTRTVVTDVRIDASDRRMAVFAEQLLFATGWEAVVGVATGEDDHGPYIQLDDATARATHVIHTPMAELLATVARELHRRIGA